MLKIKVLAACSFFYALSGYAHAAPPIKEPARPDHSIRQAIEILASRNAKDITIDPNFPLRLTLDYLTDLLDVPTPILIEQGAYPLVEVEFRKRNINDAMVQTGVKYKASEARFGDLLQLLLDRLEPDFPRSTFLVRDVGIVIIPWAHVHAEIWGYTEGPENKGNSANSRPRQMLPLVHADFDRRPLAEALKELGKQGRYSVVLDIHRAGEKARTEVTALLTNVPIDTAVRVLANQADLTVVRLDNVFYVTTEENAAKLRAEYEQLHKDGLVPLPSQLNPPKPTKAD